MQRHDFIDFYPLPYQSKSSHCWISTFNLGIRCYYSYPWWLSSPWLILYYTRQWKSELVGRNFYSRNIHRGSCGKRGTLSTNWKRGILYLIHFLVRQLSGNKNPLALSCVYQLMKGRIFNKYQVDASRWIWHQIQEAVEPIHPLLCPLIEEFVYW